MKRLPKFAFASVVAVAAASLASPPLPTPAPPMPSPPVAPPPPPPFPEAWTGKGRHARPKVYLPSLVTTTDYPKDALRAEEQGSVTFRLDIGRSGRVRGCTVLSSSGSAALDAATCRLMTKRARFEPARNHKGKRIADTATGRIVWRIEDGPPPPAQRPPPPPSQ